MPRLKFDDLIHKEPQRAARWVQDHLSDVPRLADDRGRDAVEWVQAHWPGRRDLRTLRRSSIEPSALLWPTFLAAAGAGAAFWWWTSWSRGRAEAERAAQEGAAHPETVIAHAPPPGPGEAHPRDPHPVEDAAAPEVMAHGEPEPSGKGKAKKVKPAAPKAEAALRRNLAVVGAGEDAPKPPKPPRSPKA